MRLKLYLPTALGLALFVLLTIPANTIATGRAAVPANLTLTAEPPTPTAVATSTPSGSATSTSTGTPTAMPTAPPTPSASPIAALTATHVHVVPTNAPPPSTVPSQPADLPTSTPTPEVQLADPAVTKRANLAEAQVGDEVIFTLTVTNNGWSPAENVEVSDPLPAFLVVVEATSSRGEIRIEGDTVTVILGLVAPGEIITITIRTRVIRAVAPPDNINQALLSSSSPTDIVSNNGDRAVIAVLEPAAPPPVASAHPAAGEPAPTARPTSWPAVQPGKLPITSSLSATDSPFLARVALLGGYAILFGFIVLWARVVLRSPDYEDD